MKNNSGFWAMICILAVALGCSNFTKTEDSTGSKTTEVKKVSEKPEASGESKPTSSEIAGTYAVSGKGIEGNDYQGELVVTKRDEVYQFSWSVGSQKYDGVGVQDGKTVAVAYTTGTDGKGCGAVIYKVNQEDDSLEGKWGTWGINQFGTETGVLSEKDSDGFGKFNVTGTNANGSTYKGTLLIELQEADIYQLSWDVGTKYVGTGIKLGDYLAAGSGSKQCGFVIYEVKDRKLEGQWGVPGSVKLGTEEAKLK